MPVIKPEDLRIAADGTIQIDPSAAFRHGLNPGPNRVRINPFVVTYVPTFTTMNTP